MMAAEDVAKELGVSKGHAYELIRELNGELKKAGYLVIAGKVPKAFLEKSFMATISRTKPHERGDKECLLQEMKRPGNRYCALKS